MSPEDYIKERIVIIDTHWVWEGSQTTRGYPRVTFEGDDTTAARLVYQTYVNPKIVGQIRNDCGYKHCLNPAHLYDTGPPTTDSKQRYQTEKQRKRTKRRAAFDTLAIELARHGKLSAAYTYLKHSLEEDRLI